MQFNYKDILVLMRPNQYVKNLFIFLPLFFSPNMNNWDLFGKILIAFVAFSLTTSAVYILNDYQDIEDDRRHPKKRFRPLAAGTIRKYQALSVMIILFVMGFSLIIFLSLKTATIFAFYVMLNIIYSLSLKHIPIIDITIIAVGFVLRIFIGSTVTDILLSHWIIIMTFVLALFLALAKRRDDLLIFIDSGNKMRKVLDGYNIKFLDMTIAIMAAAVIVIYTIYTTSPDVVDRVNSRYLYMTAIFVIVGVMRYLQITLVLKDSGSPTRIILRDRLMQLTLISWGGCLTWILYW